MIVKFFGQLHSVKSNRSGGGRLEMDFGRDALEAVIQLHRFFAENNIEVAVALVPVVDTSNADFDSKPKE